MQEIKGYDHGSLFDEEKYRKQAGYSDLEQSDYFTVNGEEIRDFKNERIDREESVCEFEGFYTTYGSINAFVEFLIKDHVFGLKELLNSMTPKNQLIFLKNSFFENTNDFYKLLNFEDVELS